MNETQRAAALRLIDELAAVHPLHPYVRMCGSAAALLRELLAEPVQEPVAWLKTMYSGTRKMLEVDHMKATTSLPVYTHPPQQRKPLLRGAIVGLWGGSLRRAEQC